MKFIKLPTGTNAEELAKTYNENHAPLFLKCPLGPYFGCPHQLLCHEVRPEHWAPYFEESPEKETK